MGRIWQQRFVIGLATIIAASVIVGLLGIGVLYLFGVPFLLLVPGLFLVWRSDRPVVVKALTSLLPFPIVSGTFLLSIWLNTGPPELYRLPYDFRGEFVVYFDEPCGIDPVYEASTLIYAIPPSGILITRSKMPSGYLNHRFERVDPNGVAIAIPEFRRQDFDTEQKEWSRFQSMPAEDFSKDTVGVFWSYGSETHRVSARSRSWRVLSYRDFEKDPKEQWLESKRLAEEAEATLRNCRSGVSS